MLPLDPTKRYLIAGNGAEQINRQMGGWALSWLGFDTRNQDFPNATNIADAIEIAILRGGGSVTRDAFAHKSSYDAAIMIFGEPAYAEWFGDRETPWIGKARAFGNCAS